MEEILLQGHILSMGGAAAAQKQGKKKKKKQCPNVANEMLCSVI
jgi:hypothetical protein